ncbi:MAG: hypothetical protein V7707_05035 [Motiliproteus sp.]
MKNSKVDGVKALCWISGVMLSVILLVAIVSRSGLETLAKTSAEIESVASLLDSITGLRSLLLSFSNQCTLAQQSWQSTLDTNQGLVFVACGTGLMLVAALAMQLKTTRSLQRRIQQLQKTAG